MKPSTKAALIAGGYVACLLLAYAAVELRLAVTPTADRAASSGMYGFGDSILFVGVFGVAGMVPTAAALFALRPYPLFWTVLSIGSLVLAATGAAAAVVFQLGRGGAIGSSAAIWAGYAVLRLLLSPLLALGFLVCAGFSPAHGPRVSFLVAGGIEVAAVGTWVATLLLHR